MPLYEYECEACGARFELIRKFSDPPLDSCSVCGKGPVQKLVSSPAFQFKGSGWYITDYARKSGGETKTEGGSASSPAKAESAPAADKATPAPAPSTPKDA